MAHVGCGSWPGLKVYVGKEEAYPLLKSYTLGGQTRKPLLLRPTSTAVRLTTTTRAVWTRDLRAASVELTHPIWERYCF